MKATTEDDDLRGTVGCVVNEGKEVLFFLGVWSKREAGLEPCKR